MAKKSKLGFSEKPKKTITAKIVEGYKNPKRKSTRGHRSNTYNK